MDDLSPRATRLLRELPVLIAEDTRRTRQLLQGIGRTTDVELIRGDQFREAAVSTRLQEFFDQGVSLAVVSDAGTPGVSDPGARLVARAYEVGFRLVPVLGPSCLTAILSVAGVEADEVLFRRYFPRTPSLRLAWVEERASRFEVWLESPERIESTVEFLAQHYPAANGVLGKELTKDFEQVRLGTPTQWDQAFKSGKLDPRGEWIFGIERTVSEDQSQKQVSVSLSELLDLLGSREGLGTKEISKRLSELTGERSNWIYAELQSRKNT